MPEDCSKELYDHLKRKIRKINDGYEIVSWEQDGCDEYGFKYWVECKNEWGGRDWDVSEARFYGVHSYLNAIVKDGIMFGGNNYIHPDIVFGSQYKFTTLTQEEYDDFQQVTPKLETIRDKICRGYSEYMKDKSYWSHRGPWYYGLKNKLYCSSIENFIMSLITLVSTNYTNPKLDNLNLNIDNLNLNIDNLNLNIDNLNLNIDEIKCRKIKTILGWGKLDHEEMELLGLS
jgi:hypothetical protein